MRERERRKCSSFFFVLEREKKREEKKHQGRERDMEKTSPTFAPFNQIMFVFCFFSVSRTRRVERENRRFFMWGSGEAKKKKTRRGRVVDNFTISKKRFPSFFLYFHLFLFHTMSDQARRAGYAPLDSVAQQQQQAEEGNGGLGQQQQQQQQQQQPTRSNQPLSSTPPSSSFLQGLPPATFRGGAAGPSRAGAGATTSTTAKRSTQGTNMVFHQGAKRTLAPGQVSKWD